MWSADDVARASVRRQGLSDVTLNDIDYLDLDY
jgi:hypothetical protein